MADIKKNVYRITVGSSDAGLRLDQFIADRCDDLSRTLVRKIIDLGGVHLDGRRTRRSGQTVTAGQSVEVYLDSGSFTPYRLTPAQILYQDSYLIGLNKPAGVATQPTPARYKGTLYEALSVYLPVKGKQRKPGIGMVQRLDRDTSGVMVFSIHPQAHKPLTESFRNKQVRKLYLALVAGQMDEPEGVITSELARRHSTNLMVSVKKGGKYAETRYRVLEKLGSGSLLEVEIPTGRSHQIRAHFSEQGHPLLGDTAYGGSGTLNGMKIPRQMLHACELQLNHPVTGEGMVLKAELPEDFQQVLDRLRILATEHNQSQKLD